MLVGRAAEIAALEGLLAGAREGRSGVLVLRGEAGAGKSALLEHAANAASDFRVLRGLGVEGESELAYAALHQILRPVFDRIDHLPEPQAASLRAAFGLSSETVDERFRVSLGVLGLLSEVAEERPLLCLVDDAHWVDQASADALLFAARRLQAEQLVLLFAARDDEARPLATRGLPELRVPPLNPADARALLSTSLGSAVAAGVFDWLLENAGGNPLALVELPATLTADELAGQDLLAGRLAPATSLEQAYLKRVQALTPSARTLLLLAAAEGTGARATVERACAELQLDIGELAAAESVGLVRVDAEHVVFRHPLVRSAVYRGATFMEREQAHRLLAVAAAAEGSADRAAWHRAAATVGTDDDVARELESTAERAQLLSGHAAAAAALERAAELSADSESKARRFVLAARAAWNAGQPEHSAALCDRADPILTDQRRRADVDHLRGVIAWRCGSLPEGVATLIAGAVQIAPADAHKALLMLSDCGMAAWDAGDFARLADVGEATAALPRSFDSACDDVEAEEFALLADVLVGCVALSLGQTTPDEGLAAAVARARDGHEPRLLLWAALAAEVAGEDDLEVALLRRAGTHARASGAVDRLTVVLEGLGVHGLLAGQFTLAAEAAGEGLTLARETGLPNAASLHLSSLAWLAAVQGREDECRSHAGKVIDAARPTGDGVASSIAEWALALLDLGIGRPEDALGRLHSLSTAPPGLGHPFYVLNSAPDLVEACVRTGRGEAAALAFSVLEDFAKPGAPSWALALAARCRALLSAGAEAAAEFEQALEIHSRVANPFHRARTELLYGEFLRRERRRTDAREQLRAGLDTFEQLRAEPWAERARAELRATGETARKRDASTLSDLTPQELQIARLVGEGNSNKEVAAQLFLSPRTIDSHLRNVFSKLGITSRTQLARLPLGVGHAPARQRGAAVPA
jgi:DNA-binding CsgD family transcriptional regulator